MSRARLRQLDAVYTGEGFVRKGGRHPKPEDAGYQAGPVDILCEGGLIKAVLPSSDAPPPETDEAVQDGRGFVATAGLVDCHTHAVFAGDRTHEHFMRWGGATYQQITRSGGGIHETMRRTAEASDEVLVRNLRVTLKEMLERGVVAVEVKSGYGYSADQELRLLRLINSVKHDPELPMVVPTFLGLHALPDGRDEESYVEEMIGLLDAIRTENLADQVDCFPEEGFFYLESCLRFAEAARDRGFALKAHADELTPMGTSEGFLRLGARSIDHLQHIGLAATAKLAASDCVATILPATSFYLGLAYADARMMIDAGARVAIATDYNPGTAPSAQLVLSGLLAAARMQASGAEILCALTHNAAMAVGLGDALGALTPGRSAACTLWPSSASPDDGLTPISSALVANATPRSWRHRPGRAANSA